MKELFLLRGLPGSGKSTLAESLGGIHVEADMYFMNDGIYKFDAFKIKKAHEWCQSQTDHWMLTSQGRIIVSNTFTTSWEMDYYYQIAEKFGYTVYSLIVENRHDGVNSHGVPDEVLTKMRNRFEIKL